MMDAKQPEVKLSDCPNSVLRAVQEPLIRGRARTTFLTVISTAHLYQERGEGDVVGASVQVGGFYSTQLSLELTMNRLSGCLVTANMGEITNARNATQRIWRDLFLLCDYWEIQTPPSHLLPSLPPSSSTCPQ